MIREANPPQTATAYRRSAGRQLEPADLAPTKAMAVRAEISIKGGAMIEPPSLPAETLTDEERRELHESEETLRRGARAWLEMGMALTAICDKRLHRETHKTFGAYCWEKFRIERSLVYGLMAAAKRYQLVLPIASKLGIQFTAESQMRPLCRCPAVDLPGVLKLAARRIEPDGDGNRVPTAKILTEAVQEVKTRDCPIGTAGANGHGQNGDTVGKGQANGHGQNGDGMRRGDIGPHGNNPRYVGMVRFRPNVRGPRDGPRIDNPRADKGV